MKLDIDQTNIDKKKRKVKELFNVTFQCNISFLRSM